MARSSTKIANEFKNLLDDAVKSLASKEDIDLLKILIRDDTHMTSMKTVQFSRPPPPTLSIYVQNYSTPLTLDV